MSAAGCELCERVAGEGDLFIADLDACRAYLNPDQFFPGWVFVVLRRHATELYHLSAAERARVIEDVNRMAHALADVYQPVKMNYELLGNQVAHIHWHLIPRLAGGSRAALAGVARAARSDLAAGARGGGTDRESPPRPRRPPLSPAMLKPGTARDGLWLALLLLALGAVMAAWVSLDRRPPEWDHANHLERALECHRILAEPGHDRLGEIVAMSSFYPPVVLCAAGLAYFVLPASTLTAQAVIWMFLVVGALAVWGLGRRLLDPAAGLLAAFCFVTAPFVVFSLLRFQLDLPLAAAVAVALYALVRAEAFQSLGWSLALGVVLGLGMLVKPPFAAYLLPPLAWAAWLALRAPDRGTRLRHLTFALLVGGLVALPWYGPRLAGLPMQILNRSFKQATESPPTLSSRRASLLSPRVSSPGGRARRPRRDRGRLGRAAHAPGARPRVGGARAVGDLRLHSEQEPPLCPAPRARGVPCRLGGDDRARPAPSRRGDGGLRTPRIAPGLRRRLRPAALSPSARAPHPPRDGRSPGRE